MSDLIDTLIAEYNATYCGGMGGGSEAFLRRFLEWQGARTDPRITQLEADRAELVEKARVFLRLRQSIEIDVRTAHSGRGNGVSSAMREDDRDMRSDLSAAFDALSSTLSRIGEDGK